MVSPRNPLCRFTLARIKKEDSLKEGWSRSDWPMGLPVRVYFFFKTELIEERKPTLDEDGDAVSQIVPSTLCMNEKG